jgi:hypothetical protein
MLIPTMAAVDSGVGGEFFDNESKPSGDAIEVDEEITRFEEVVAGEFVGNEDVDIGTPDAVADAGGVVKDSLSV